MMMPLIYQNDLEGVWGNKVSIGGLPSAEGAAHEIFSIFELFGFLRFRRHFMIIIGAIHDYLEREDAVDRNFRKFLCINRYKLAIDSMPIVPNQIYLFTNQFPDLGMDQWCNSRD
jgi:hypothetical protein